MEVSALGGATMTNVGLEGSQLAGPSDRLAIGSTLGGRFEILKLLGEGGMGAVYKARDLEVDRVVALKVIRPEFANRPEILARFKQELVLSRQVTHRNVIRIFDLGQADRLRFITMEFVEGQELHSLLKSPEPPTIERKIKIAREICLALEAAHEQGVVHRDLKPQNIMIENGGRVLVMDFGIARSVEDSGLTSVGAMIGTPAFMSPEQAKGEKIDTRSDLFSFGVILYEMLTGRAPYQADTMMGLLMKRIQEAPTPPLDLNHDLPQALSDIVLKCLTVDREQRYQTAQEVVRDLDGWLREPATFHTGIVLPFPPAATMSGATTVMAAPVLQQTQLAPDGKPIVTPAMKMMVESDAKKWIAISVGIAAMVLAAGYGAIQYLNRTAPPAAPTTVLIADFENHTGDPVFSGTLESTLKRAMEGATFIGAYDRTQVKTLGIPAITGKFDESAAQKIAVSQGLNVVLSGSLDRRGAEYQLSLRAIQPVTGKVITNVDETAPGKDQVLFAVTKLASSVRKALGDAVSESSQRLSMSTLSAASLEAVHEYAAGLDLLSKGNNDEALQHFSKAVDLDPNFGLAYTGMAAASNNRNRQQDAEKYIKQAIQHIDLMTERERFFTRASLYVRVGDYQKCVDEYSTLLAKYPADTGAHNNLAVCLTKLRSMPKAMEEVARAVAVLPKRAAYHANLSMFSSYAGDFQNAAKEAGVALQLNPAFSYGFQVKAFAHLGQGESDSAAQAYQSLQKFSASDATIGLADLAVYEGRFNDAVKILQSGEASDRAARNPDGTADKLALLAYTQLSRNQIAPALQAAKSALEISKQVKIRFMAAQVFVAAGEADNAKYLVDGLATELQTEPQAYAKLIAGEAALKSGNAREAVQLFTQANSMLDTWIGRFNLGRAYLELGQFAEADSEFDRCIKRRGEALALFLDASPTFGRFPLVYYYQGRVREGMKSKGFVESYRQYLKIRAKSNEDPLLPELRRLAAR